MSYSFGQIDQTIKRITGHFPEFSFDQLYPLFTGKFSDKQIALIRYLSHQAFVDRVEGKDDELKELINQWI